MTSPLTTPDSPPTGRRFLRLARWLPALGLACVALCYGGCWAVGKHHDDAAAARLRERDFLVALDHLAWCRRVAPRDPQVWLVSAQTARRAGRYGQAREWLDVAEKRGARPSRVRQELALLRAQEGGFALVEGILHELLPTSGQDYPLVAEVLTDVYMREYRFPEARAVLDRWVERYPEDDEAWLRRAWTAEHQFDVHTALKDYRRVLELAPERDPVRLRLAELYLQLRRPADAAGQLEPVLERRPTDREVAVLSARCQRELGRLDRCAAALDALADEHQRAPDVLAERGHLALARGETAEAEKLLREALRDLPRRRDLIYALQQSLIRQGKKGEADELGKALKQEADDSRRMGELMAALSRTPADANLRFEVARIFQRSGLLEDAVRWLRLTIEANPKHAEAREQLAICYEKQGKAAEAAAQRKAAERLRPPR